MLYVWHMQQLTVFNC